MDTIKYIGTQEQISGVEMHRLENGKGAGMRLAQVRNGLGLEFTVSQDRCADIPRLSFMGRNMNFFASCGYVAPAYYDDRDDKFLKGFTAGFLTTCGLTTVGTPAVENGEELPLHGTIGNTPAEYLRYWETDSEIVLEAEMRDAYAFGRRMYLIRRIVCSKAENTLRIIDRVENRGGSEQPVMILYHINTGYPLLSEKSEVYIPSVKITPRTPKAAENIDTCLQMLPPQPDYEEECFFHEFEKEGKAMLYNPDIDLGLAITFPIDTLNQLCEWKMMGNKEYVLGLEPGNCSPDGRAAMRAQGKLQTLKPEESREFSFTVRFYQGKAAWDAAK